jgi:Uma2 family endonuclease
MSQEKEKTVGKVKKTPWTAADYEHAAQEYCRRLPLEHFMEAFPQSAQREITVESLAVLKVRLPDLQVFNEMLIQYWRHGRLRRVVPDNMVRRCDRPLQTVGSFNLEMEPVGPLLVVEYVSPGNPRKDYKDSFLKYEQELRVPFCLMFYPERQDLRFWRHTGTSYEKLQPDARGRYAIPPLELELGLLEGWVRFWHQGELLLLPADLQRQLDQERQRADHERQRAEQERQRAEQERQRAEQAEERAAAAEAEVARLRSLLDQSRPAGGQSRKRPPK